MFFRLFECIAVPMRFRWRKLRSPDVSSESWNLSNHVYEVYNRKSIYYIIVCHSKCVHLVRTRSPERLLDHDPDGPARWQVIPVPPVACRAAWLKARERENELKARGYSDM